MLLRRKQGSIKNVQIRQKREIRKMSDVINMVTKEISGKILVKIKKLNAVFFSGKFKCSDWYIDSNASIHMTVNESWLNNVSTYEVPKLWRFDRRCL